MRMGDGLWGVDMGGETFCRAECEAGVSGDGDGFTADGVGSGTGRALDRFKGAEVGYVNFLFLHLGKNGRKDRIHGGGCGFLSSARAHVTLNPGNELFFIHFLRASRISRSSRISSGVGGGSGAGAGGSGALALARSLQMMRMHQKMHSAMMMKSSTV